MKKKYYLEFYYKYAKSGRIPYDGLCSCFTGGEMYIFEPTEDDCNFFAFWGNGGIYERANTSWMRDFTPLRQNIVLFLAAMHGEL